MIKSVSLLTRKAGLSHEEFVKHWLEVHAPLAYAAPGLRRYVQSPDRAADLPRRGLGGSLCPFPVLR
jgi:uncharacterized protein (TIGR02118 family)